MVALILLKGPVIFGLCRLFALTNAAALRTSLLLTQGGEFGFVLFGAAGGMGVMGTQLQTTALLVISLSMAATPFLVRLGDRLIGGLAGVEAEPTGGRGRAAAPRDRRGLWPGRAGDRRDARGDRDPVRGARARPAPGAAGARERRKVFYGDGSDPRAAQRRRPIGRRPW